ncbi:hypothetical protein GQX74_003112 [Glossina fuscipes]|nr:hypothetical protein GQX74_003112 [Glossina fuscipes]
MTTTTSKINYNEKAMNSKMASNAIGNLLAKNTSVMRTPPSRTNANALNVEKADVTINGECLNRLKQDAQQAFIQLGCKLNSITAVMADDRNVYKINRDNVRQVMALYQEFAKNRKVIAINFLAVAVEIPKENISIVVEATKQLTINYDKIDREFDGDISGGSSSSSSSSSSSGSSGNDSENVLHSSGVGSEEDFEMAGGLMTAKLEMIPSQLRHITWHPEEFCSINQCEQRMLNVNISERRRVALRSI